MPKIPTFVYYITTIIHNKNIRAPAAVHGICTCAAVKDIAAGITGQNVIQAIAEGIDIRGSRQVQVFHVIGKGVSDGAVDSIGPFIRVFQYCVAHIIHMIGIVAQPAHHGIRTGSTVKDIVPGIAD